MRGQAKSFNILETKDTISEFAQAQQDFLETQGSEKVVQVTNTTRNAINAAINASIGEGENRAQTSRRIRNLGKVPGIGNFDASLRAAVIARTEVHTAANVAEFEMTKALGVSDQVKKRWIDAGDDRRSHTHQTELWSEDQRVRPMEEPFNVGGAALQFPGDPTGPAKEIIMCRCALGYVTPDPTPEQPRDRPGFESGDFRPSDFNKAFDDPDVTAERLLDTVMTPEQKQEMGQIKLRVDNGTPTHILHKVDGKWTRERARLHKSIINEFLSKERQLAATPAAGEAPTVTFFGGRGGSGKGWFTRAKAEGGGQVVDKTKNIILDADEIKKRLFKFDGVDGRIAGLYHEESAEIFDRIVAIARRKRWNIVLDKTLKTTNTGLKDARFFAARGYNVDGYYMYLPRQEAGRRAILRTFGEQQRYVPVEIVLKNTTNEETFESMIPFFRKWRFYNNQVPRGASPILEAGNF